MNKLRDFILSNKVYSKCSEQEQEEIVSELERVKKIEKALDKACEELKKMCKQTKCSDCHFIREQIDCNNDCPVQGNLTSLDWKRWCKNENDL